MSHQSVRNQANSPGWRAFTNRFARRLRSKQKEILTNEVGDDARGKEDGILVEKPRADTEAKLSPFSIFDGMMSLSSPSCVDSTLTTMAAKCSPSSSDGMQWNITIVSRLAR